MGSRQTPRQSLLKCSDLLYLQLVEIVIDLGRKPVARFQHGQAVLSEDAATHELLDAVVSQVPAVLLYPAHASIAVAFAACIIAVSSAGSTYVARTAHD